MAEKNIFLSYSPDEDSFVQSVATELRKRGVGLSEGRTIAPDDSSSEQLHEAMQASSVLVAFIGRFVDSPWVNFEIGAAVGQSKPVLPVFLSRNARESAPAVVQQLQGIDASNLKPREVADQIADVLAAAA